MSRVVVAIALLAAAVSTSGDQAPVPLQPAPARFVVILRPGPAWPGPVPAMQMPHFEEHAAYVDHLAAQKKLLVGGPFTDWTGGLLILEVSGKEEAQTIMQNEPWVRAGVWTPEIHPWLAAVPGCVEKEAGAPPAAD